MTDKFSIGLAAIVGALSCQFATVSHPVVHPVNTRLSFVAAPSTCEANDPKERPLNVRSRPGGKIVGRITNGMLVERSHRRSRDQWEKVGIQVNDRPVKGWVYTKYLICK